MRNEKSFYITRTSMEKAKKLHKKIIFLYIINLTLSNQRPLSCKNNMMYSFLLFKQYIAQTKFSKFCVWYYKTNINNQCVTVFEYFLANSDIPVFTTKQKMNIARRHKNTRLFLMKPVLE